MIGVELSPWPERLGKLWPSEALGDHVREPVALGERQ